MTAPLWIASFVYLAFVSSWVFSAVREDEREPVQVGRQTITLFAVITGGTLFFVALIFLQGLF